MLDSNQISNLLNDVDPQLCACFAVRCSLRVLPLLVADNDKEPFWYWPDVDVSNNLLSFFKTLQASVYTSVYGGVVPNITDSFKVSDPDSAAYSATFSAVYAKETAADHSFAADAAVYSCLYSFPGSGSLLSCIRQDLHLITNNEPASGQASINSPTDLLSKDLWYKAPPAAWNKVYEQWKCNLTSVTISLALMSAYYWSFALKDSYRGVLWLI